MSENVKRINRELKYSGAIVDVYSDTMEFANGNTEEWDFVSHRKGAAAVVAVLPNGKLLMVHQYRNAIDGEMIEIPAGSRDSITEDTKVCAARELEEETGYKAGKLELLISLCTTVAFCDEFIDIYLATELVKTVQNLDANEYVEIKEYDLSELIQKIFNREIRDGKTIAAILAYNAKLNQK